MAYICVSQTQRDMWKRCLKWLLQCVAQVFLRTSSAADSYHRVHMLGLTQHLFAAEQDFDLVMTSGNVSLQQRRGYEFGGGRAGVVKEGGETVRRKQKKKKEVKKKGRHRDEEQRKGLRSRAAVVSQHRVRVLIADAAWGRWRSDSGSWARWGPCL